MKIYAVRFRPGQDFKIQLMQWVQKERIQAGIVLSAVGSLQRANLRFANQNKGTVLTSKFEIVSCIGTLCQDGLHIHLSLSDSQGKTIGGHLLDGCEIYTTAEMVIGSLRDFRFSREEDKTTDCRELEINPII